MEDNCYSQYMYLKKITYIVFLLISSSVAVAEEFNNLDGPWKFYWNQLIDPEQSSLPEKFQAIELPTSWLESQDKNTSHGYASYVLDLKDLDSKMDRYSVYFDRVYGSSRLYVVDPIESKVLVAANTENFSTESNHILFRPLYAEFKAPEHGNIRLIVHLSNQQIYRPGIHSLPKLSFNQKNLEKIFLSAIIEFISLGIIIFGFIYSLTIWTKRKEDKASLLLAYSAFIIGLRAVSTSSITAWLNESVASSIVLIRLEYLSIPLASIFAVYSMVNYPCPNWLEKYIKILYISSKISALSALILPIYYFQQLLPIYQLQLLLTLGLSFVIAIYSLKQKADGARLNLVGLIFLVFTGAWDVIIVSELFLSNIWLGQLGAASYLALQSHVIAIKNARAHQKIKKLAQDNESHQRRLRLETESRLKITSTVAHYVNNPLNYIQLAIENLKGQIGELSEKVSQLFDSDEENQEMENCRRIFEADFKNLSVPIDQAQLGLIRASDTIKEIRGLSGLDGNQISFVSLSKTLEESLNRIVLRVDNSQSKRLSIKSSQDFCINTNPYTLRHVILELIISCLHNSTDAISISYYKIDEVNFILEIIGDISILHPELEALEQQLNHLAITSCAHLSLKSTAEKISLIYGSDVEANPAPLEIIDKAS